MEPYPVLLETVRPARFERLQLALRAAIVLLLGSWSGLFSIIYFVFPAISAVLVARKGSTRFLQEEAPRVTRWLRWLLAVFAYVGLLTDRFPVEEPERLVRYEVQPEGRPSVGSALLRLLTSIPSFLVLAILTFLWVFTWLVSAVFILFQERYPERLYRFHRGILRWEARWLAYHTSLVGRYPPFSLA